MIKPGARVTVVYPLGTEIPALARIYRAIALDTQLAGFQLARVEGQELKVMLVPSREGERWARGWSTKAAKALRAACAL